MQKPIQYQSKLGLHTVASKEKTIFIIQFCNVTEICFSFVSFVIKSEFYIFTSNRIHSCANSTNDFSI